jgi:hypothetical protein
MTNHAHVLVRTPRANLGDALRFLLSKYARHFNERHDRTGHLFERRYRADHVDTDRYLMAASAYIHNNPVEARMVRHPSDYAWSSYNSFLDPAQRPPWIHTDTVLAHAGGLDRFRNFTEGRAGLVLPPYDPELPRQQRDTPEFIAWCDAQVEAHATLQAAPNDRPLGLAS